MKTVELIQLKKTTYSVPEIRKMLGLGKTDSYWLLQHRPFEVKTLNGQMRVTKSSFDNWYDNQVKYKKVDGTPPGTALRAMSYSVSELANLLSVSDTTIYEHYKQWGLECFTVDFTTRITKESFEAWYPSQEIYRIAEDREKDKPLLENTYSMPDMRRMLGLHRNQVYYIVDKAEQDGSFEFVYVAGQKRVTKASFWHWYEGQSRYRIKESSDRVEIASPSKAHKKKQLAESTPAKKTIPIKSSYRIEDLMYVLGVGKKAAYTMIQNFEISAIKAGNTFIIPASSFNALLEERGLIDGNNQTEE